MGLFDRLLGSRSSAVKVSGQSKAQPKPQGETFFLDAEASSSLGDVSYMRRSNTIRRTFPGNADSPGEKELVVEVASMEARLEKITPGLGGAPTGGDVEVNLTGGVPKAVKKTFAQQMSPAELEQRLKGSAVSGVNVPGGPAAAKAAKGSADQQPSITQQGAKPGAIDPFKAMAKDLNG